MTQTAFVRRAGCGLSRSQAEQYRATLATTGLGPVSIRRGPDRAHHEWLLDVRIGPFRRLVATEADVRALLEERQTCFF